MRRGLAFLMLGTGLVSVSPSLAFADPPPITESAPPAATSEAGPNLFDPEHVVSIDLSVTDSNLATLTASPREYVPATITIIDSDVAYGPYDVGLKLKGHGSFRDLTGKAAFRVKFSHVVPGQRLFGLKGLTLNNMIQDPSMMSEALAYEAFRGLGVPAPRSGYAFVRVNGEDYGLYADVETIDSVFAARWFPTTQHVFEGEYGADVTPQRWGELQVSEGSATNLTDLHDVVMAAASSQSDWPAQMHAVTDLDEMVRVFAVEHLVKHVDSYSVLGGPQEPNNYYLHTSAAGVMSIIPSGTDMAWFEAPIPFGQVGRGFLFRGCIRDLDCRTRYVRQVGDLLPAFTALGLGDSARRVAGVIAPWIDRDPRKEVGSAAVADRQAAVIGVIEGRVAEAEAWLVAPTFIGELLLADPSEAPPAAPSPSAPSSPPAASPPAATPLPPAAASSTDPVPPRSDSASIAATAPAPPSQWTRQDLQSMSAREFATLPPSVLALLSARQGPWLTRAQLGALGPDAVRALSVPLIESLSARQLAQLSARAMSGLTPQQLGCLRPAQVVSLTHKQVAALRPVNVRALTPAVARALLRIHGNDVPENVRVALLHRAGAN